MNRWIVCLAFCYSAVFAGPVRAEVAIQEITRQNQAEADFKFTLQVDRRPQFHCRVFKLVVSADQQALEHWDRTVLEVKDGENIIVHADLQPQADPNEPGKRVVRVAIGDKILPGAVLSLVQPIEGSESQIWYSIQLASFVDEEKD